MKRKRRRRAWIAIGWMAFVVLGGLGTSLALALRPAVLEARVRHELSRVLNAQCDFTSLAFSWTRGVEVRNLRLSRSGSPRSDDVIVAPLIRVLPSFWSLLRGRFELRRLDIVSPRVQLSRGTDGQWSFDGLLSEALLGPGAAGSDLQAALARIPSVVIEDGRLTYNDEHTFREPIRQELEDVYAGISRGDDGELKLTAQVRVPFARKLVVRGTLHAGESGPVLRADFSATKLDLSAPIHALLPRDAARVAEGLKLSGYADILGTFRWDPQEGFVPISLVAELLRAELTPPYCTSSIKGLRGKIIASERSLEVPGLEGAFGNGKASLSAKLDFAGPWIAGEGALQPASWTLRFALDSFTFDHRARDALPAPARAEFEEYDLQGNVGIEARIVDSRSFPPRAEDFSATIRLQGADFVYRKFPYPVTDVRGDVLIEKGRVMLDRPLVGRNGGIEVAISGPGVQIAKNGAVDLVIKITSVPLDDKFRAALPLAVHPIWDDFQVLGSGDALVRIVREAATGDAAREPVKHPRVTIAALPRGIRMSYRGFPYEIEGITGKVVLDTGTDRLIFEGLRGKHGDQEIQGSGVVELDLPRLAAPDGSAAPAPSPGAKQPHSLFRIDLHADTLAVDDDLVAALSEEGRRMLRDFDFRGSARMDVSIHSTERAELEVTGDVNLLSASISYKLLPYVLELGKGRLQIFGDKSLVFTDVATPEGAKPFVVFNGSLTTQGTERTLNFDFDIKELKFDEKLIDALPPTLASFVTSMKLGGVYQGRIEASYTFDEADPKKFKILYAGQDVSAREASVDFGVRIHDMIAHGSFAGGMSPEHPHRLSGRVFVESAWFNRLHLTQGDVDFALGQEHPAIAMARRGEKIEGRDYLPPKTFQDRLVEENVKGTFQMLVHSNDVYGGKVDGFLYVDTGTFRDMAGDFVGSKFDVARAALDVFGANGTGTAGTASGAISFHGKSGDFLSIEGAGSGAIQEAKLVELPLFLGLLSLIFGDNSSRHYFHEVLVKYGISGGFFRAPSKDGIVIRSSGVKLEGGGTMDFSGNLDLTLQPYLLDFKIPLVDQILSLIKKGVAQVRLVGDLSNPKAQFATAGGIFTIGLDGSKPAQPIPLPADLREGAPKEREGAPKEKDLPPGPK